MIAQSYAPGVACYTRNSYSGYIDNRNVPMSSYEPIYTSTQVANAAGMTAVNFRAHLMRGHWRVIGAKAGRNGQSHKFSIFDAVGYALAYQLEMSGVDPKTAFDRAMTDFAHGGNADRDAGDVMDYVRHGLTIYVYCPGAPVGECVGSKHVADAVSLFIPPMCERAERAILINMNDLRRRVELALDWTAA
ncbi:hypothetical protein BH10PSE13_BH10PSE13_00170 [soil metagenome]